jgi:hypothetical protein
LLFTTVVFQIAKTNIYCILLLETVCSVALQTIMMDGNRSQKPRKRSTKMKALYSESDRMMRPTNLPSNSEDLMKMMRIMPAIQSHGGTESEIPSLQDSLDLTSSKMVEKYSKGDALKMIEEGLKILDLDDGESCTSLTDLLSSTSTFRSVSTASSSSSGPSCSTSDCRSSRRNRYYDCDETAAATKPPRARARVESSSSLDKKLSKKGKKEKTNKTSTSSNSKSSDKLVDERSNSNSKASKKKKRPKDLKLHTRFRLSKNEYIPPAPEPLTPEEKSNAWWTRKDFAQMSSKAESYIAEFDREHPRAMQDIIRLVAQCYAPIQPQQQQQQRRRDDGSTVISNTSGHRRSTNKKLSTVDEQYMIEAELMYTCSLSAATSLCLPSRARGFEYDIVTPLKQSRRRHTQTVLNAFGESPSSVRHILSSMTGDDLDEMVAARSMVLSRPHRIFARALAEMDADAVSAAALGQDIRL